jgi:hypothetical protein
LNRSDTVTVRRHFKHMAHYIGGVFVRDEFVAVGLAFQIAIRREPSDKPTVADVHLLGCPDFSPDLKGVLFVHHIF